LILGKLSNKGNNKGTIRVIMTTFRMVVSKCEDGKTLPLVEVFDGDRTGRGCGTWWAESRV
jgi:hypothetical protein